MHHFHNTATFKDVNTKTLNRLGQHYANTHTFAGLYVRKFRDPHVIIVRNKYTKEIVDLEVGYIEVLVKKSIRREQLNQNKDMKIADWVFY